MEACTYRIVRFKQVVAVLLGPLASRAEYKGGHWIEFIRDTLQAQTARLERDAAASGSYVHHKKPLEPYQILPYPYLLHLLNVIFRGSNTSNVIVASASTYLQKC